MFDVFQLKKIIVKYKEGFVSNWWPMEKFKWVAVKCFQDNWDVNASDFAEMLTRSLAKTNNLLASNNNFPAKMIQDFAKIAPEEVRTMFIALFDESKSVVSRILEFKKRSSILLKEYGNGAKNHYQLANAISTYLWLRYPDKYYIYKLSEVKYVAEKLGNDYLFRQGAYNDNLRNFFPFYNEIRAELKKDKKLVDLLKSQITDDCYPDPDLCTLTIDIGYYIKYTMEWWPMDYSPELSVDEWVALLGNKDVFNVSSLEIVKRIMDCGGQATCKQLSDRYGENMNFYNSGSVALARRVAEKTNCPIMQRENGELCWWTILYLGKKARKNDNGFFVWRLRSELYDALDKIDLTNVNLYVKPMPEKEKLLAAENKTEKYNKATFLNEVYMAESKYDTLVTVLKNKKNIILQGAPGVGKTFAAKRLAYSIMGEKNENHIEFIQFHQNYSYEDFVMGYKPVKDSFELKYGIFYRFCKKAEAQPDKDFFFIIDEINRGNMSKIFGELLLLIERDYRGMEATLAYNDERTFFVPNNIYIIGMMNTADRSLAMIDYALRRRFSFFNIEPGFDSEGFMQYQQSLDNETFSLLISKIQELNNEISSDRSLGKGFCIGHSYFCNQTDCTEEWMRSVVEYDILPILSEYWFDDTNKLQRWENILRGVFL